MEVVEGTINLVGSGTWTDNSGAGAGKTVLSVFEIGDKTYKKLLLTDYMSNYIRPDIHAKLLIAKGLSQGVITRPFIAAAKIDGKTYKEDSVLMMSILKSILYIMLLGGIGAAIHPLLGLLIACGIVYYYGKDYMQLQAF